MEVSNWLLVSLLSLFLHLVQWIGEHFERGGNTGSVRVDGTAVRGTQAVHVQAQFK